MERGRRAELYGEAQRSIRDDGDLIVPMFSNHPMGVSKYIGHSEDVATNWELYGARALAAQSSRLTAGHRRRRPIRQTVPGHIRSGRREQMLR